MIEEIIFIYSFCHDLLRELGLVDDAQCKMNAAEIMTVAFVSAIYFHGNQRCKGCVAIETLTKEVIENDFAEEVNDGKVVFHVIDFTKPENEAIAEKYEAAWSSLFVTQHKAGKETIHDMTEFGFSYAKGEPEVFKQGLKEKIENLLK